MCWSASSPVALSRICLEWGCFIPEIPCFLLDPCWRQTPSCTVVGCMGIPLESSCQHHAGEVISVFQVVIATPAPKHHLPPAPHIPACATGTGWGGVWAWAVQVKTGGKSSRSGRNQFVVWVLPGEREAQSQCWELEQFPTPIPKLHSLSCIQQRMVKVFQGRLMPAHKNLDFKLDLKLVGKRGTFWWLWRGRCGCGGCGSWGRCPHGMGSVPTFLPLTCSQPLTPASSSSPGPCPLLLSFFL